MVMIVFFFCRSMSCVSNKFAIWHQMSKSEVASQYTEFLSVFSEMYVSSCLSLLNIDVDTEEIFKYLNSNVVNEETNIKLIMNISNIIDLPMKRYTSTSGKHVKLIMM